MNSNSTGKKIVAKVAAVAAVSGLVFALPATSATPSPVSAVALAEPQASPPGCKPPSLAHCYTEETMPSYMNDIALPRIVQFFKAKYKAMPEPHHYYFILKGHQVPTACQDVHGEQFADDNTYAYCRDDQSIYLGQARAWEFYDKVSAIAPIVALAHEWGHNIQARKGVPNVENVQLENQADCVAGAWFQYAGQQKWLRPEDASNIDQLIKHIAGAESPHRDHGTPEERRDAMLLGMKDGLKACNRYFPQTPIITGRD